MIDFWILGRPHVFRFAMAALIAGVSLSGMGEYSAWANGGSGGNAGSGAGGVDNPIGMGGAGGNGTSGNGGGGGGGAGVTFGGGGAGDGLGGSGGNGGVHNISSLTGTFSGTATGGAGSMGSTGVLGGGGGGGGAGGFGAVINTAAITVINDSGSIAGGTGGAGGAAGGSAGSVGGGGGTGGVGLYINQASVIFNNVGGTVAGGNGGAGGAGNGSGTAGTNGAGGVGIMATAASTTIFSSGAINGGLSGDGVNRNSAIVFGGGTNTLELQAGYSFLGNVVSGGFDTLILSGATDASFDLDTLMNFDSIQKNDASTWTVTGSTFIGPVAVNAGALYVNGDINGGATVAAGATIGGIGSLGSVNLFGTLDPGAAANSVGTLTVTEGLSSAAGSTFHVDFNGNTADLLSDQSLFTTTLNSAVFVHGLPGSANAVANQNFLILEKPNGDIALGPSVSISDDLAKFDAFLRLSADMKELYFYLIATGTFADLALTPNEIAVANYLDQTEGSATGDYQTVIDNLNTLNADQLRAAYNQLGGESFGTSAGAGLHITTLWIQHVVDHIGINSMLGSSGSGPSSSMMAQAGPNGSRNASTNNIQLVSHSEPSTAETKIAESCAVCCDCSANERLWNAWSSGYGLGGSAQGAGGVSGASYSAGGVLSGVDRWIDDSTMVGVFGGYLGASFSTGTPSSNVHDNAGMGGLYALRRGDVLYAQAIIGGQADSYTSHRNINFAAINRTAVGNYDGWQGYGYTELGANLGENKLKLQPFGAMQYIHLRQNSVSETGAGSINLVRGGIDADSLRSFVGTRLRYDHQGENNLRRFIPELQATWLHEYVDASVALNARFAGAGGTGFYTNGLNTGRDWALLGAGTTYIINDNFRLTAYYYTQTNERQTYHVGAGGVNVQW